MYLKLSAAAEDRVSVSVKAVDDSFTHPWRFMFRGTAKAHDLMEKACQFAESWLQQYTGGDQEMEVEFSWGGLSTYEVMRW